MPHGPVNKRSGQWGSHTAAYCGQRNSTSSRQSSISEKKNNKLPTYHETAKSQEGRERQMGKRDEIEKGKRRERERERDGKRMGDKDLTLYLTQNLQL